jgi:hypothetical protein
MRFIREESVKIPLSYIETIPVRKFKEDMDEEQKRNLGSTNPSSNSSVPDEEEIPVLIYSKHFIRKMKENSNHIENSKRIENPSQHYIKFDEKQHTIKIPKSKLLNT